MSQSADHPESRPPLERYTEGFHAVNPSPRELPEILEAAFDYRGDVTIELASGEAVCGYLFNRDARAEEPFVDLYLADSDGRRRILYRDIRGVRFSGKDTASGKSWETWVKQFTEKRAARERGEEVGQIGLQPEPLD